MVLFHVMIAATARRDDRRKAIRMTLERDDVRELVELGERQLEELRALRAEAERQSELMQRMVDLLASLDRSQYS